MLYFIARRAVLMRVRKYEITLALKKKTKKRKRYFHLSIKGCVFVEFRSLKLLRTRFYCRMDNIFPLGGHVTRTFENLSNPRLGLLINVGIRIQSAAIGICSQYCFTSEKNKNHKYEPPNR